MTKSSPVPPHDRARLLDAERNRKMAASAHAYVRGSTVRFYEWLGAAHRLALPEGPNVWICGDCHVGNLGPVASAAGQLAIQVRDLDQTVIGNPAHDLVRLGLSLAMAARGSDLPGVTTAHMLEHMVTGYEAAFEEAGDKVGGDGVGDDEVVDDGAAQRKNDEPGVDVPKLVRLALREAAGRSWKHLADERIEGTEPRIPLGARFWPLTGEERAAVDDLFGTEPLRQLVTSLRMRDSDAGVRVMDAAYWRKGCSSLGRLRLAVLVAIGHGKVERHCLMDVKEAIEAAAPRSDAGAMPADHGERVVTGARHLSPYLGGRMVAARMLDRSVFVRELLPQDLKLEIEDLSRTEAMGVAQFLAYVVGQGHARQLEAGDRGAWLRELQANRTKTLDAPSWLWNSVVDLVGVHEAAYLRHCRRYALDLAV